MTSMQAALGLSQLSRLDEIIRKNGISEITQIYWRAFLDFNAKTQIG